jgi:hypothetical protein
MTKIAAEQLERSAIVYVRQSTAFQVTNNIESGRRQYGLIERARQLGWADVQVFDDDLGRSGGGIVRPPCCRSKLPDWPVMAGTGTRCWNFADWSGR